MDVAFQGRKEGVYIQSRQDADLFKVTRFKGRTKCTLTLVRDLLFADDSALIVHSPEGMQQVMNAFSDASKKFGLKIKIKKTSSKCCTNQTLQEPKRWTFLATDTNSTQSQSSLTLEAQLPMMVELMSRFRKEWPRLAWQTLEKPSRVHKGVRQNLKSNHDIYSSLCSGLLEII